MNGKAQYSGFPSLSQRSTRTDVRSSDRPDREVAAVEYPDNTRSWNRMHHRVSGMFYQLRIELREIEPCVWRLLQVPGAITLSNLHKISQIAMCWTDSHLHELMIGATRYGVLTQLDDKPPVLEKCVTLDEALRPTSALSSFRHEEPSTLPHSLQHSF